MTTNNLTELWKKGELEDGWYYVSRNNDIEMLEYVGDYFLSVDVPLIDDKDVSTLEVLAPVPSFDEWRQMKAFCEEFNALEVAEENKKLKELLETCQAYLDVHSTEDGDITINDITTTAFIGIIEEALNG